MPVLLFSFSLSAQSIDDCIQIRLICNFVLHEHDRGSLCVCVCVNTGSSNKPVEWARSTRTTLNSNHSHDGSRWLIAAIRFETHKLKVCAREGQRKQKTNKRTHRLWDGATAMLLGGNNGKWKRLFVLCAVQCSVDRCQHLQKGSGGRWHRSWRQGGSGRTDANGTNPRS